MIHNLSCSSLLLDAMILIVTMECHPILSPRCYCRVPPIPHREFRRLAVTKLAIFLLVVSRSSSMVCPMYGVQTIQVEQRPDRFFSSSLRSDIIIVASNEKWGHVSPRQTTEIEQSGVRLSASFSRSAGQSAAIPSSTPFILLQH
jgi:hypothetical protein